MDLPTIGFGTSSIHSLAITGTTVSLFRGGSLDAQDTSAADLDTSNSGLSSDRYLFQYANRHAHEDVGEIIDTCYECSNPIYMDDARCRNCGSWDVDSDAFGAEYEQHLIKMAHSLYPPHRMFEANV